MKKLFIVLLIVGLLIPAVSASTVTKEITQLPYSDFESSQAFDFAEGNCGVNRYDHTSGWGGLAFSLNYVQYFQNVHYFQTRLSFTTGTEGYHDVWYQRPSDNTFQRGVLQFVHIDGGTIINFWPTNWEVGSKTGSYSSYIYSDDNGAPASQWMYRNQGDYHLSSNTVTAGSHDYAGYFGINRYSTPISFKYHLEGYTNNAYSLSVTDKMASLQIDLQREFPPDYYYSVITLYDSDDNVILTDSGSEDLTLLVGKNQLAKIKVVIGNNEYIYLIALGSDIPATPDAIPINIRVQNSQTGALLADAHINISASVNGTFHEVVNETLPAGTKTYYLQPTGGGLPNPDFYRLIATVEGYNPIMPYIDFEADIATTIYAYLNPIGGAPIDENKTFIDFYVRDLNANPVSGATVKFGAYTLLTNSAGYTIFEVDKDNTYTWTVSKSGYGSVTGNAVIGSNARYTINAVIAPAVTPTLTTPIPTSPTVGPTPTMTAPTGEPVSNLLEWFAAHFGMLLGGGVEIGKIFMWLCFTIPAGVYVGKEAKAGAAGFLAGAGIVTLFFVIIGWVPVWLVVLLALIVGLLYFKVFTSNDNGGGR